ncbi:MAG TPA: hypothetical protein VFG54_23035 [Prolixibacteraceae bacterium]|nr:hypothetical protein [Prolixibacteraceae bacterium]
MNAGYFVLISALLAFATGLFVASIIWVLKWLITPKDDKRSLSGTLQLLHVFTKQVHLYNPIFFENKDEVKTQKMIEDSVINKELYKFHHGKH